MTDFVHLGPLSIQILGSRAVFIPICESNLSLTCTCLTWGSLTMSCGLFSPLFLIWRVNLELGQGNTAQSPDD